MNRIINGSVFAALAVIWLIQILLDNNMDVWKILALAGSVVMAVANFVGYYREKKNG
mgnify:FL=1